MPTCFVTLFDGRVGSTHLARLLASHPDVSMEGEILGPVRRSGGGAAEQAATVEAAWTATGAAAGFKTKLRDVVDRDALASQLTTRDGLVVVMDRRNEVKAVVSLLLAKELSDRTGAWNVKAGVERVSRQRIERHQIDRQLAARRERQADLDGFVAGLGRPSLRVWYEDLLTDEEPTLGGVQDFLGLRPTSLSSSLKKATSDDLRDVLLNFDELVAAYAGTPLEAMFREVLVPGHSHRSPGGPRDRAARLGTSLVRTIRRGRSG